MKRPTIKGMGAKLFEPDATTPSRPHNGMTARQHDGKPP
jgi:hypothetical protein